MADNTKILVELALQTNEYLKQLKNAMGETEKQTKKTASTVSGAFSAIKGSLLAVVGSQAVQSLKEFYNEAGKYDTIKRAYENLTASYGTNSKKLVEAMQTASQGTLSQKQAMEAASNAIQLMGEDVIKMLPKMATIAKAAARASGKDVANMMNDIVTASGRQSTMILDNLGISSVVAGQKQEEYAKKLGKTREQLTEAEKSAAFFYAVTEAGGEIVKRAGDATLTLGEQTQVLNARYEDFKDEIFDQVIPALTKATGGMNESAEGCKFYGSAVGSVIAILVSLGRVLLNTAVFLSGAFLLDPIQAWKDLRKAISDTGDEVLNFGKKSAISSIMANIPGMKQPSNKGAGAPAASGTDPNAGLRDSYNKYIESANKLKNVWGEIANEQARYKEAVSAIANDTSLTWGQKIAKMAQASKAHFENMVRVVASAVDNVVQNIASKTTSILSAVNELQAQQSQQQLDRLDAYKNAFDGFISWQTERELSAAGVSEQTTVEKAQKEVTTLQKQIAKTKNLKQKKALQEQLIQKQDELKKAKIQEESDARRQQMELLYELFRRQMVIREFNRQKAYQISIASINMAAGIIGAIAQGIAQLGPIAGAIVGAVEAAAVAAVGGVQIAMISAQQPPVFAQGAWELPSDMYAQVHEGETILPKPFAEDFREAMSSGSTEEIHNHIYLDGEQIYENVVRRDKKAARLAGAKSRFSYAGA